MMLRQVVVYPIRRRQVYEIGNQVLFTEESFYLLAFVVHCAGQLGRHGYPVQIDEFPL